MLFLIEYVRSEGRLVMLRQYSESEQNIAENRRLELELDLNRRKIDHEVVLLEAPSKEALLSTHSRYFKNSAEIAESFGNQ